MCGHVSGVFYCVGTCKAGPLVQAEQQRATDAGDNNEAEVWRHKLHHYLDQLFQKDQTAGADYHVLQVQTSFPRGPLLPRGGPPPPLMPPSPASALCTLHPPHIHCRQKLSRLHNEAFVNLTVYHHGYNSGCDGLS